LVGREEVLRAGEAALSRACAGYGRLVLLAGEAGIGKTSVARALTTGAGAAGALVRWGACWEGQEAVPFSLWIDCLRRPGGDACATAAAHLEEGGFEVSADGGGAIRGRLRSHAAVIDALAAVAEDRPQVLVLDDLHWADASSVELLVAVAAHLPSMPVLVVGTYRDDELPPSSPLLSIGGNADRIVLGGLGADQVTRLLTEVLGRAPSSDEARTVHRDTGGNPLFVTEVGRLVAAGSPAAIPSGVSTVLARRLARLPAQSDRVLGAASVLGTTFDVDTVAAMIGGPLEAVTIAVDEAATARLVAPSVTDARRWSFTHPLLATARYEQLGPRDRATLHRRAFDVLSAAGSAPAGSLVRHALRGRFEPGDPHPAASVGAAAGDAVARLALDDALRLARQALDLAPSGGAGDEVRAVAWLAMGDACLRRGEAADAASAFEAAAAIGRAQGRSDIVARAALGFGAGLGGFEVRILDARQVDLLEEAAVALPHASPLRPVVLARLSVALSFVGSGDRRLALAEEAVAGARRSGDRSALAAAIAARCDAIAGPDHTAERLGASSEVIALAQRAGDLPLELLGRRLRVVALLEMRDMAALEAEMSAFARSAAVLDDPLYTWYVPLWRAMGAYADGRVGEARRLIAEAGATGRSAGSTNAEMLRITAELYMAIDRRDLDGIAAIWAEMRALAPDFVGIAAALFGAYMEVHLGRAERARAHLDRHGLEALAGMARDQEWLTSVCQVVSVATIAGCEPVVRRAMVMLAPYAGLGVFEGIAAVDHGVVDRFLAVGAAYLGDHDAARAHTAQALLLVAGAGRLVQAHTRADCARALARSPEPDDRARAAELARAAIAGYEAMGFGALAEELRSLPRRSPSPVNGRSQDAPEAALGRDGDTWLFTFEGTSTRIRHAKGVADLAVLLARPGREVHVRELEGAMSPRAAGAGPVLDEQAVAQYRRRLHDIEEDLDEADRHADLERAAALAAERDALVSELTKAFGLGGRARLAGSDPDERLRKAVSARVKATIDRLDDLHPRLAAHLRRSVRTGFWCAYEPERPVSWDVVGSAG
jgi:tetratricopeptide (TPR) repeat protein